MAALTVQVFSWPQVENTCWIAQELWYYSLLLSIWAVITSVQHSPIIDTLPSTSHGSELKANELQVLLQVILWHSTFEIVPPYNDLEQNKVVIAGHNFGAFAMTYVWQTPMMLMSYALVTFLVALFLHVCTPLITQQEGDNTRVRR
jgi:hypothetical protein